MACRSIFGSHLRECLAMAHKTGILTGGAWIVFLVVS